MKGSKKNARHSSSAWLLYPEHTTDPEKQHYALRTSTVIRVSAPQVNAELLFILCAGKSYYPDKLLNVLRASPVPYISLISRAPRTTPGKK